MKNNLHNQHKHLIEQSKLGNRQAQYALYNQYVNGMFTVCNRIVKNDVDAEDVLQESFVAAFKSLDKFRYESTFGAWLKRIVVNRSINFLNKKKIDLVSMEEEYVNVENRSIEEPNTASIDPSKTMDSIKSAINQLSAGGRVVLSLYLFEGYDHKEIAEILEISESTSKSQYSRAKQKLRKILNAQ